MRDSSRFNVRRGGGVILADGAGDMQPQSGLEDATRHACSRTERAVLDVHQDCQGVAGF